METKKDRGQLKLDTDECKGCGICAEECPCGANTMVPDTI